MLWTRFTFVAILFGVTLCNCFLDKRLIDFSTPYAAAVRNSDAQKAALLESLSNVNFLTENPKDHHNDLTVLYQNEYPFLHHKHQDDQRTSKYNGNLVAVDEDFATKDLHEIVHNKNDLNKEIENDLDLRTGFGLEDLNLMTHEKLTDGGGNAYDELDANFGEAKALAAMDFDSMASIYQDLLPDLKNAEGKRGASVSTIGCDCKIKNDLLDLGQRHFPRYLLNAVCQSSDVRDTRCWRGVCKPLEYKVKVLTLRTVKDQKDPALAWLPDDLRQLWKFKTVTVAAGCFCAVG